MDNNIFVSNEVFVYFLLESILLILQFIAIYNVVLILKNWDFNKVSSYQYNLEKKSYLVTLLIIFSFFTKIVIYPYFIYSLDILSNIIPGAMCAAGVLTSNIYGESLLIVKTLVLFVSGIWIVTNKLDIKTKNFLYLKKKFYLYVFLFVCFLVEFTLNILYFSNLSTRSLVTCCSIIYSETNSVLPFDFSLSNYLYFFYMIFISLLISNNYKKVFISGFLSLIFFVLSYYMVIYFFGTYIYELPTHHCPFCMLQSDYGYIGYFIFLFLFLGVFFSFLNFILRVLFVKSDMQKSFIYANICLTFFVFIITFYVLSYYIKNGVFL